MKEPFLLEFTGLQITALEVDNSSEETSAIVVDRIDLELIIACITAVRTFDAEAAEATRSLRKFFDNFGVFVHFD